MLVQTDTLPRAPSDAVRTLARAGEHWRDEQEEFHSITLENTEFLWLWAAQHQAFNSPILVWCNWCRFLCPMSKPSPNSGWLGQLCSGLFWVLSSKPGQTVNLCRALSQPLPREPLITQSVLAWEAQNFLNSVPIPLKGCFFCPTF